MDAGIEVVAKPYDEWNRELVVTVRSSGFSGVSSGYIGVSDITEFTTRLQRYPLDVTCLPTLVTGFGADADHLEQAHISLRAYPTDSLGHVAVRCELQTPMWPTTRPGFGRHGRRRGSDVVRSAASVR
jgi:hypothetical protein